MKKLIRILFTSIGRRVELIQCFRRAADAAGIGLEIWGADLTDTAPALFFCDKRVRLCRISDADYIPMLLSTCSSGKIELLIPTIDTDLMLLAGNREKFAKMGTRVLVSSPEAVSWCRDKRLTAEFFQKCGLKTPVPVDDVNAYHGKYPCFIKPKDGSSSIDAYRADSPDELAAYAGRVADYIIQPFIEGTEYTVDILCDFEGRPVYITPRERMATRSGEVLKTRIKQDDTMIRESIRIIERFQPCGPITVQLIRQAETEENYYIEINPRFGGGAPLSMLAGADSAGALLHLLLDEMPGFQNGAARDGLVYSRYDQSVCVSDTQCRKRTEVWRLAEVLEHSMRYQAVIFDLDDTLYPEKDYVRSGFHAVAETLPEIPDAEQKLWEAFEKGENAIDALLNQSGICTAEKKAECLKTYRQHIPQIYLSKEARDLLEQLLGAGKKIGIITDGRPEGQRNKIRQLGLCDYVQEIIVTDELAGNAEPSRFRKPMPLAFEIMQKRLQCDFRDMVYVGDNARKDFTAPDRLGMGTVWFKNQDGLYQTTE